MAFIVADMPKFSVEDGDDFDVHVRLLNGYFNTIGLNPNADGGVPAGRDRAMGVLRSSLRGSIAEWFDEHIMGKNWKLTYFISHHGNINMAQLRALPIAQGGANALRAGTFPAGSPAAAYSAAHPAATVGAAFIPDHDMFGGDAQWERIGAEPSDDPVNAINNNNNRPIVLTGTRFHQAVSYMRRKLPSITDEKRKVQLHRLVQGNDPVRIYWKKIERAGKLLRLSDESIVDHFYRGLSTENLDKAEEFDPDYPINKVVDILEKIEKRRFERQLENRPKKTEYRYTTLEEAPPIHRPQQEAAELRKATSDHLISKDHIDKIVNAQTDKITKGFQDQIQAFQEQIQALQNTLSQPKKIPPPVPPKNWNQIADYARDIEKPFGEDNLTGRDYLRMMYGDDAEIIPSKPPPKSKNIILAAKALAKAQRAKEDRQVDRLAELLEEKLNLNDDPVDTTNIMDEIILQDADGNEFTAYVTRGKGSKKKMIRSLF